MTTNSPKRAHIQVSPQSGTRRARYSKQEQTRVQGSGSRTQKPSWPQMTTNSPKRAHIQVSPQSGTRRARYRKQEQTRVQGSGFRVQDPKTKLASNDHKQPETCSYPSLTAIGHPERPDERDWPQMTTNSKQSKSQQTRARSGFRVQDPKTKLASNDHKQPETCSYPSLTAIGHPAPDERDNQVGKQTCSANQSSGFRVQGPGPKNQVGLK